MGRGEVAEKLEAKRQVEESASVRRESDAPTWFARWAGPDDRRERAPLRERQHLFHC